MALSQRVTSRLTRAIVIFSLLALSSANSVRAQQGSAAIDEDKLLLRLKQAVMKELRQSDFLKKEIEAGIKDYIKRQREAQAKARAEQQRLTNEAAKHVRRVQVGRDHILGNANAEVSLIEYSDFECPYCKRFHPTPKKVVELYKGRVNWVYRHFPLGFHNPGAQKQAEASECAAELGGNRAFWSFTDAIYARTRSNGRGFPLENLVPLAEEIGLEKNAFKACLDSGKFANRVEEDLREGAKVGISGTPGSILLNNRTGATSPVTGAMPLAQIKAKIDEILK